MSIQLKTNKKMQREREREKEPSSQEMSMSRFTKSKLRNPNVSKLSIYETNIQNYIKNQQYNTQKIDPKGIASSGIYVSFTGVIQQAQLFDNSDQQLQLSYQIKFGNEWHDQTPEVNDSKGQSTFCQAKNGKITFSLGFDTLVSCMYIASWPQLLFTIKGFNAFGNIMTKGYGQIFLPTQPGPRSKEAYIYTIIRNQKWYHKWLPFLEPTYVNYDHDQKQFERVIQKGEGRQTQKVKVIGKIKIKSEVILRNYSKFGYK